MAMTKPAGCAAQLIGLALVVGGLGPVLEFKGIWEVGFGALAVIAGVMLFLAGRKPAVEASRSRRE